MKKESIIASGKLGALDRMGVEEATTHVLARRTFMGQGDEGTDQNGTRIVRKDDVLFVGPRRAKALTHAGRLGVLCDEHGTPLAAEESEALGADDEDDTEVDPFSDAEEEGEADETDEERAVREQAEADAAAKATEEANAAAKAKAAAKNKARQPNKNKRR